MTSKEFDLILDLILELLEQGQVEKVKELSNKLEVAVNGFYKRYGLVA